MRVAMVLLALVCLGCVRRSDGPKDPPPDPRVPPVSLAECDRWMVEAIDRRGYAEWAAWRAEVATACYLSHMVPRPQAKSEVIP